MDWRNHINIGTSETLALAGNPYLRVTDSEYWMLNNLAKRLGRIKGRRYIDIKGELKIVSENSYCISCAGVIKQFNIMFPNIKLIIVNGAK